MFEDTKVSDGVFAQSVKISPFSIFHAVFDNIADVIIDLQMKWKEGAAQTKQ